MVLDKKWITCELNILIRILVTFQVPNYVKKIVYFVNNVIVAGIRKSEMKQ